MNNVHVANSDINAKWANRTSKTEADQGRFEEIYRGSNDFA